ncbi:MAG: flagellar hook-length control protein FliK, partial [Synergistaceae bacterium]|nr:flagellar hook-length control protein FliK [Synergistaceae bacterium]
MAVQAAAPSAAEFIQATSGPQVGADATGRGGPARGGNGSAPAFKKMLAAMRSAKQELAPQQGEAKAISLCGVAGGECAAIPADITMEMTLGGEIAQDGKLNPPEFKKGRFDPDVMLGEKTEGEAREGAPKIGEVPADQKDSGAESATEPASAMADALILAEAARPDPETDAPVISGETPMDEKIRENAEHDALLKGAGDEGAPSGPRLGAFARALDAEVAAAPAPDTRERTGEPETSHEAEPQVASTPGVTPEKPGEEGKGGKSGEDASGREKTGNAAPVEDTLRSGAKRAASDHATAPVGADRRPDREQELRLAPAADQAQAADSSAARADAPPVPHAPMTYVLSQGNAFGDGLVSLVTLMRSDGAVEAHMVVEPPALGRVDISLNSTQNGVEAAFRVDNDELKRMVQSQLDSLKGSLEAQGIHVSGLTVDIRNSEGRNG